MKKKVQAIFLQIQHWSSFTPKKLRANRSKKASWLAHHAPNNKNKIVAHPTDHGNGQFGPMQQPTNNPAALI
jgi:hypothetical protein